MNECRYAIITPAHNESSKLPRVIRSVTSQSILPLKWIIIDDRSVDDTWSVLQDAAKKYNFIKPIKISGDSDRKVGANVVRVFNKGLAVLSDDVDYLVKMDADVVLPADYFYRIIELMHQNPNLGMASGKTYVKQQHNWSLERMPDTHVPGPCKTYRMSCFKDIDGLIPLLGWDIMDGAKARMKGWKTASYRDIPIYHLRQASSAKGMFRGRLRTGLAMYTIRAHPLFVLAKAFHRSFEKPYFSGMLIPIGYFGSFFTKAKRVKDTELARFVRREHLDRLTGKTLAQEELFPKYLKSVSKSKDGSALR
jgi:glycosyltransferase involved in cell wall biosynthesis